MPRSSPSSPRHMSRHRRRVRHRHLHVRSNDQIQFQQRLSSSTPCSYPLPTTTPVRPPSPRRRRKTDQRERPPGASGAAGAPVCGRCRCCCSRHFEELAAERFEAAVGEPAGGGGLALADVGGGPCAEDVADEGCGEEWSAAGQVQVQQSGWAAEGCAHALGWTGLGLGGGEEKKDGEGMRVSNR